MLLATVLSNAYFYLAVGASAFFILQAIFTFIGIGDNFDAEIDADVDFTDGLSMTLHLFTIRGIISFFMVFGWSGFILTQSNVLGGVAIFFISLGTGTIMLLLIALVYYLFEKLSQQGNVDLRQAIGKQGSVYIPIPKRNEGMGKIQIILSESLKTLDAIAKDKPISTGSQVKVVGVINEMLEVEEITNKEEEE
jgi:membrane-bound ClpP family serine protease